MAASVDPSRSQDRLGFRHMYSNDEVLNHMRAKEVLTGLSAHSIALVVLGDWQCS